MMKNTIVISSLIVFLALVFSQKTNAQLSAIAGEGGSHLGLSPVPHSPVISFTENKGQVHDQNYQPRPDVLFSGNDAGLVFHLKRDGVSYQLSRVESWKDRSAESSSETQGKSMVPDQTMIYRLDIQWMNARTDATVAGAGVREGYNNYYLESCPNGALGVKSYNDVFFNNLYAGIDLKWYSKNGQLKYDYLVGPGADFRQIRSEVTGADSMYINDDGELVFETPLGDIIESAPLVTQNGRTLKSGWVLEDNVVSFEIENIDPAQAFVIDPAMRVWGTYYGGSANDEGNSCATDPSGNVYMTGLTISAAALTIATVGSHQDVIGGGGDGFLVKFNSGGVRLWGTYYGGSGTDEGTGCATDPSGNVYMAGFTSTPTSTAIATAGSYQPAFGGGSRDAFVAKFNSAGVRQWGTYYGGTGTDDVRACASDSTGNIFLTGETNNSGAVLSSAGCHQTFYGGGTGDAYLVKFNSSGVREWGTYYGGSALEYTWGCNTDLSGNIYLAGFSSTTTAGVIATAGSHQPTHGGGGSDIMLVKFNSSGVRQWGTYYGGSNTEQGYACVVDTSGNIYLTGHTATSSGAAIATAGAHQLTNGGGGNDAFLVKFNSAGVRQWGTFYGGTGADIAHSLSLDASGNVYMAGRTETSTGTSIATPGSYQSTYGGGAEDAFLVLFNPAGVRQWGTYYGGIGRDRGYFCATGSSSSVYVTGYSDSTSVLASAGSHQPVFGGTQDAFLVKFSDCIPPSTPSSILGAATICEGSSNEYSIAPVAGATSYTWTLPGGWSGTSTADSISTIASGTSGNITVSANNSCGSSSASSLSVTVNAPTVASITATACDSYLLNSVTYSSSGTFTQTLTNAAGCDSTLTLNLTINNSSTGSITATECNSYTLNSTTYTSSGTYTQTLTNAAGCDSTLTLNLTIETLTASATFAGSSYTASPAGAAYQWVDCDNGFAPIVGETNQVFTPAASGNYAVIVTMGSCTDTSGCDVFTGISGSDISRNLIAYPNPTTDALTIIMDRNYGHVNVETSDVLGRVLERISFENAEFIQLTMPAAAGVYFVSVQGSRGYHAVLKIVKE